MAGQTATGTQTRGSQFCELLFLFYRFFEVLVELSSRIEQTVQLLRERENCRLLLLLLSLSGVWCHSVHEEVGLAWRSQFSVLSTFESSRIELKSSGVYGKCFVHWALSPAEKCLVFVVLFSQEALASI